MMLINYDDFYDDDDCCCLCCLYWLLPLVALHHLAHKLPGSVVLGAAVDNVAAFYSVL